MPPMSRALLWEYLGHPDDETPERRRVLYAIVALRLGLGPMFLLRGWDAAFASTPIAFAVRLGDPARWGLGDTARDQILFILGCTELLVGLFLLVGVFTRVSAVTGGVLLSLTIIGGDNFLYHPCNNPLALCASWPLYRDSVAVGAALVALGGLAPLILCGSPFLSADRFLDKVEEEERDHAPARLPDLAVLAPLLLRIGMVVGLLWSTLSIARIDGLTTRLIGRALGFLPERLAQSSTLVEALALVFPILPIIAPILGSLLLVGWKTRAVGVLAGGISALLLALIFLPDQASAGGTSWLAIGPLTVLIGLALVGGGRFSLDKRRPSQEQPAAESASPLESHTARH